jgi:hypothetical protein
VRLVKAALATVDREASDGYNSQTKAREGVIAKLADDLALRNPVMKAAVKDLITLMIDAIEIDNPVIRFALAKVLQEVIGKLGIDKVAGQLMQTLINDLTGHGKPSTLEEVSADTARRIGALEDQWADFMVKGGPEIQQAGEQWKAYGSLAIDAAVGYFFYLAATNPAAWARDVNDTAGTVVNVTAEAVVDIIRKV